MFGQPSPGHLSSLLAWYGISSRRLAIQISHPEISVKDSRPCPTDLPTEFFEESNCLTTSRDPPSLRESYASGVIHYLNRQTRWLACNTRSLPMNLESGFLCREIHHPKNSRKNIRSNIRESLWGRVNLKNIRMHASLGSCRGNLPRRSKPMLATSRQTRLLNSNTGYAESSSTEPLRWASCCTSCAFNCCNWKTTAFLDSKSSPAQVMTFHVIMMGPLVL